MAAEEATDYTSFKLAHASPAHLHITSLSKFIGPIPQGWLTAHKKHWGLPRTNYHKRRVSFTANELDITSHCPGDRRWQAEACVNQTSDHRRVAGPLDGAFVGNTGIAETREENQAALHDPTGLQKDLSASEYSLRGKEIASHRAVPPETTKPIVVTKMLPRSALKSSGVFEEQTTPLRPSISITSPTGGFSTRESSSVSQASFATAPETLEEQAALVETSKHPSKYEDVFESEEEDEHIGFDVEDEASDTSTIRVVSRKAMLDDEIAEQLIPQQIPRTDTIISGDPSLLGGSPSSSEDNSRKSLMNHGHSTRTTSVIEAVTGASAVSHLVRFKDGGDDRGTAVPDMSKNAICVEGRDIDRKAGKTARRRNQGYFNQRMLRNPFRKAQIPGELLRAERMLVRVEVSSKGGVPADYSESLAPRVERRTERHWREFIVAARNDEHGNVVMSLHRSRTVPAFAKNVTTAKASEKFVLDPTNTKANLYSALDKTIVIWQKGKKLTQIFILRPKTANSSIAWYAFIQTSLKHVPRPVALISVPNLNVKLRLELAPPKDNRQANDSLEAVSTLTEDNSPRSRSDNDSANSVEFNELGQIVASGVALTGEYLIDTCWRMLGGNKEWSAVLKDWRDNEKMGLCWRRYDRLEWIHGQSARQLIGTWAMQTSHELEFRPKEHYSTEVRLPSGNVLQEPPPVEGFLVRLTGSSGRQARFGKVFYKRLYFSTHDGLLFYASPSKSRPPPPPNLQAVNADDVEEAVSASPLIYNVDPYPLKNGRITWLQHNISPGEACARNSLAMSEAKRRVQQLHESDGFIDLSHVVKIRRCRTSQADVDNNIGHNGEGTDFHEIGAEEDNVLEQETGLLNSFDDERVFELVLSSGLVIRLQSYNGVTRQAWMEHLSLLVRYWHWRHKADAAHYRKLRQANVEALAIDEETEGLVGQYASKWEVTQCVSEPQIYNFCPLSSCRTIALRGLLYRKPRVHSTFRKYECVISHGKMFIYNHMHWDSGGNRKHHIHHSRRQTVDLSECYVYSGNVTQNELIGTRETSDREGPGRRTLPRRYTDGWTSQDEQETLCFVIWTGRRRVAFRGVDRADSSKDNSVSRLGVPGYSMIYMARCRQERDLWVQLLNNEIERSSAWG